MNNTCLLLGDGLASHGHHQTLSSTRMKADPEAGTGMCRNNHCPMLASPPWQKNKAVLSSFLFRQCRSIENGSKATYSSFIENFQYSTVVESYSLSKINK